MFDGLKDKLGQFRDDVEEEAGDVDDGEPAPEDGAAADSGSGTAEESEPVEEATGSEPDDGSEPAADDDDRSLGERAKLFATGKTVIDEGDLDGPLEELELALLSSDVEMAVADAILDRVRERLVGTTRTRGESVADVVEDALKEALVDVTSVGQFDFEARLADAEKPVVVVFTGVNGVGKTTSIAKLANRLESRGFSTVLANGDTYRAGANEQLQEHAAALDLDVITHEQGGDPAAVIYDAAEYAAANDVDVVLGDTAGRLHTSDDLMAQLEKIGRVVDPDVTVFVDEAVAGQDAVNRAREFDDAMAMDGAILTKADADADGGAAISIAHATGTPVLFLGTGQGYDDLVEFDPESLVEELFE